MSAFVDTESVEVLTFPEMCAPKADGSAWHGEDTITIGTELSYGDILHVTKLGQSTIGIIWDTELATLGLLNRVIRSWSFVHADGSAVPVGMATIRLLRENVADRVAERADELFTAARAKLPNAPSVPSPASPSATANASSKRTPKH